MLRTRRTRCPQPLPCVARSCVLCACVCARVRVRLTVSCLQAYLPARLACSQVPTGLTGKQGGKLLASFLLSERDNPVFGPAFQNGVLAWLKREQSKYNLWPAQKLLWAETIKYFPKLEAGLRKAQAAKPPMPDFGMPSTLTAPPPMPSFS